MSGVAWVPIALFAAIERGTSAGAVVDGAEIVVWRDLSGVVHAWEDRCPHRGMKLSLGFVRGNQIACLYHGWEYGADGRCRRIPAHPDLEVPATIAVPVHAVAESGGFVLVRPGGEATDPPAPDLPEGVAVRSVHLDAPAARVTAHLAEAFGATTETALAAGIAALDTDLGRIVLGVQSVDDERSALHLVMAPDSTVAHRLAAAGRAVTLRRRVEADARAAA